MIHPELLDIVCCPETKQPLQLAPPAMLDRLRRAGRAGALTLENGKPVREEITAGLVREDGRFIYPIRNDIPILLIDERIAVPEEVAAGPESENGDPAGPDSKEDVEHDRGPDHQPVDADAGA